VISLPFPLSRLFWKVRLFACINMAAQQLRQPTDCDLNGAVSNRRARQGRDEFDSCISAQAWVSGDPRDQTTDERFERRP